MFWARSLCIKCIPYRQQHNRHWTQSIIYTIDRFDSITHNISRKTFGVSSSHICPPTNNKKTTHTHSFCTDKTIYELKEITRFTSIKLREHTHTCDELIGYLGLCVLSFVCSIWYAMNTKRLVSSRKNAHTYNEEERETHIHPSTRCVVQSKSLNPIESPKFFVYGSQKYTI